MNYVSVPETWQSKAQRSMTMSNSEMGWVPHSLAVKEVMSKVKLLQSMNISQMIPTTLRVNNIRAIIMVRNLTAATYRKHVDMNHKNGNEYVKDGRYHTKIAAISQLTNLAWWELLWLAMMHIPPNSFKQVRILLFPFW